MDRDGYDSRARERCRIVRIVVDLFRQPSHHDHPTCHVGQILEALGAWLRCRDAFAEEGNLDY